MAVAVGPVAVGAPMVTGAVAAETPASVGAATEAVAWVGRGTTVSVGTGAMAVAASAVVVATIAVGAVSVGATVAVGVADWVATAAIAAAVSVWTTGAAIRTGSSRVGKPGTTAPRTEPITSRATAAATTAGAYWKVRESQAQGEWPRSTRA
ncbi:MAG: hypothetical protein WKF80_08150 [Thermomicrobiales bacterium]